MTFNDPTLFKKLAEGLVEHAEHKIGIAVYGDDAATRNIAVECEDCQETLIFFCPKRKKQGIAEKPSSQMETTALRLITEFHFQGSDIGSHHEFDVSELWGHFSKSSAPSHIVIRPGNKEGLQLSNSLYGVPKMTAALTSFVNVIDAAGGITRFATGFGGDSNGCDLGDAYVKARKALGLPPRTA